MGEVGHRLGDELLDSWRSPETLLGVWESLLVIFIKPPPRPSFAPIRLNPCVFEIE